MIAISCYRRVVSFKHTHLVDRIGLLTLIIMGEGIIGMTGSVSTILQNTVSVTSSDIGQIIASVLLIVCLKRTLPERALLMGTSVLHLDPLLRSDRTRPFRHYKTADLGAATLPPTRSNSTYSGGEHTIHPVE